MSGQDAHSLDSDPRFAMAAMDDFRLLPGSPALNAGAPFAEVDHDYLGRPRSREHPAIGACEEPADDLPRPAWSSLSPAIKAAHE